MLYTTQEHKNTNNKMADRRVATAIISFLLLDDDEVKTWGRTQSWIKRQKQRGTIFKYDPRITHGGHCKLQRNATNGLWHFLEFVGQMLYNMSKVCANHQT